MTNQFGKTKLEAENKAKRNLTEKNEVPIALGEKGKRLLIPKIIFMGEKCPANDITRMLKGEKDFKPDNGFLPLPQVDERSFEIIIEYLGSPDECELPDDSQDLERLIAAAKILHVDDLITHCREQRVLNDADLNPVHVYEENQIPKWIQESPRKIQVYLKIKFPPIIKNTSVALVNHINFFFKLGRIMRRLFVFVYVPKADMPMGLRWEFYRASKKLHLLEFTDEWEDEKNSDDSDSSDDTNDVSPEYVHSQMIKKKKEKERKKRRLEMCKIKPPSTGASRDYLTQTIPETFITLLTHMPLRDNEKKAYMNIEWWYEQLENC